MATAWVTGARGFIGRYVAKALHRRGYRVLGLGHGVWTEAQYTTYGLSSWLNGEVSDANLERLTEDSGPPEAAFHLAGGSSVGQSLHTPEEDFKRTVVSSLRLLEWCRNHAPRVHLVLASSAAVYGSGHSEPIGEDVLPVPFSPYGCHKYMAEILFGSYARHYGLPIAIVRLFSVFGVGLRKQLLWDLCQRLLAEPRTLVLAGRGDEQRDWLHAEDAAEALVTASELASADGFLVNGGTGRARTVREVAIAVRDAWGSGAAVQFNGTVRPGDPHSLVADVRQASAAGIVPRKTWSAEVQSYVEWFRREAR